MKKLLFAVLMISLLAGVATVWATVIGTPHDLAPEPCAMCHTPHNAAGAAPLWNRIQTLPTGTTYSMYNSNPATASNTFDMGGAGLASQPRYPSNLCLVCHNGYLSTLSNYPGPCSEQDGAYDLRLSGCAVIGTDLTNDHPISFNYDTTKIGVNDPDDDGFPTTVNQPGSSTRQMLQGTIANYPLYGNGSSEFNWFECGTCHSVHDIASYVGKGDTQVYFLRADNTGSGMCLDCHTKR